MDFAITPGFAIVVVSWIAGAVASAFTKDSAVMIAPFIITVGWAMHYIS